MRGSASGGPSYDDDDEEEDDNEVEDKNKVEDNKGNNNDKGISALGLDRDLGFLRGHPTKSNQTILY